MPAKAGTDEEERARGQASEKLELRRVDDQLGVYAIAPIDAGERLIALARVFVDRADRFTIQIDELLHQAGTFEMDDYLNHSCHPNCFLDFEQLAFVALRPIAVGEQLSFNYLSSEWSMATPFRCWCDATGPSGSTASTRSAASSSCAAISRSASARCSRRSCAASSTSCSRAIRPKKRDDRRASGSRLRSGDAPSRGDRSRAASRRAKQWPTADARRCARRDRRRVDERGASVAASPQGRAIRATACGARLRVDLRLAGGRVRLA